MQIKFAKFGMARDAWCDLMTVPIDLVVSVSESKLLASVYKIYSYIGLHLTNVSQCGEQYI